MDATNEKTAKIYVKVQKTTALQGRDCEIPICTLNSTTHQGAINSCKSFDMDKKIKSW